MKAKKILILLVLLFLTVSANAFFQVEIDGIYYTIDEDKKIAIVIGSKLSDVIIPESISDDVENYKVTKIDYGASWSDNLVSVTIPNSVKTIGKEAFFWCPNLTTVTIGNGVENIEEDAFLLSNKISKVNISDIESWCKISFANKYSNPLSIARHLYMNGSEVNEIVIPNSITSIGDYAFYWCNSVASVTIPNSVTSIGVQAFEGCDNLSSLTIPNSVTSIGESAFYWCGNLAKVNISDLESWCNIDFFSSLANPLNNKPHLYINNTEVRDLIIPNNVAAIKDYTFSGCRGLNSIEIPNSVESIGEKAFSGCDMTSVTIPNSVTNIGKFAFWGCSGLSSVTIPNSVTLLGDSTFSGCIALTSAIINCQIIGDNAFDQCKNLNSLTIGDETTSIGKFAFRLCNISSLKIGDGVTTIGRNAFSSCKSLKSLEIGKSVAIIEDFAFQFCSSLSSIVVNEENIVYDSRNNCNAIIHKLGKELVLGCQNTIIPNDITSIGDAAFLGCTNISSLSIPNSVTKIGYDAFYGCTSLADVYCLAETIPSTNENAFDDSYLEHITLHVPAGSIEDYRDTAPWRDFGNIVALTEEESDPSSIVLTNSDSSPNPINYYNMDGKRIPKPQRGLNIIKMSDGATKKMFIK